MGCGREDECQGGAACEVPVGDLQQARASPGQGEREPVQRGRADGEGQHGGGGLAGPGLSAGPDRDWSLLQGEVGGA